jgi:hypothetical protein
MVVVVELVNPLLPLLVVEICEPTSYILPPPLLAQQSWITESANPTPILIDNQQNIISNISTNGDYWIKLKEDA